MKDETCSNSGPAELILNLLRDVEDTAEEQIEEATTSATFDEALAQARLRADCVAASAIDRVVSRRSTTSLPIERRERLLDSLDLALAERRRDNGQLQSVLRRRRYAEGESLATLSARLADAVRASTDVVVDVGVSNLQALESGTISVTASAAIVTLATWAAVAGLGRATARAAFLISSEASSLEVPLYSAAGAESKDPSSFDSAAKVDLFLAHFDIIDNALRQER